MDYKIANGTLHINENYILINDRKMLYHLTMLMFAALLFYMSIPQIISAITNGTRIELIHIICIVFGLVLIMAKFRYTFQSKISMKRISKVNFIKHFGQNAIELELGDRRRTILANEDTYKIILSKINTV